MYLEISIEKLVPANWNYKTDDERLLQKLINNINKNGQIENIIVRELSDGKYEVVNGNHRFKALQRLGIGKAYCYNLGSVSEIRAKEIAITTNETRFRSDEYKLSEIIKELSENNNIEDLSFTMPFSEQELSEMCNISDVDWEQEEKETTETNFNTSSERIKKDHRQCPKCKHKALLIEFKPCEN